MVLPALFASFIKKVQRPSPKKFVETSKSYYIDTDQVKKLELARGHLDYLDDIITQTKVELYIRIKPYYRFVEYISSLPGITELVQPLSLLLSKVKAGVLRVLS